MTEWKMITIPVEVHEKLMMLKGILGVTNLDKLIGCLMKGRGYDDAFFERIQEKINDE